MEEEFWVGEKYEVPIPEEWESFLPVTESYDKPLIVTKIDKEKGIITLSFSKN